MFNIFRAWYDDSDDDDILRIKDKFRLKSWIRVMVSVFGFRVPRMARHSFPSTAPSYRSCEFRVA